MCGVYMIRCRQNGWYYIGGTTLPFPVRFDAHRSMLRRGKGPRLLQACYDLHGEDGFDFVPLKTLPPHEVAAKEAEAIATLKPDLNIYGSDKHRAQPRGRSLNVPTYVVRGENLTTAEIAQRYGLKHATVRKRVQRGMFGDDLAAPSHGAPRKPYVRRK